jgi:hypothetical protein
MKGPVLICGIASESPLAMAIAAAERLGVACRVIDQRQLAGQEIEVGVRGGRLFARWWNGADTLDMTRCGGAYTRVVPASMLRNRPTDGREVLHDHYFVDALNAWLEVAPLRVANRLAAGMSNASKPWQAQLIRAAGFATPMSLLTNDPDAVRAFRRRHGRVVFKSASGVRSIVTPLEGALDAQLERVRALPTLFQAYVPGVNYRVHVVGEQVFCTRIDSDATDYRYAGREGKASAMVADRLPPELARRCVALTASLGLEMGGIDLKRTPEGEYVCFEVNPSPAYSCFDRESAEAVAEALVIHLSGGARHGSRRKRNPLESTLA